MYKTKAKNAQEAHEAIRPTDFRRQPDKLKGLNAEEARLYKLIWQRAVASQMASADFERTTVEIAGETAHRRATTGSSSRKAATATLTACARPAPW